MATDRTGKISTSILIAYYLTVAVFYAASFFPEYRLWGIDWFGYFDWYGPVIFLAVASLLPLGFTYLKRPSGLAPAPTGKSYALAATVIVILLAVSFCVFRGRTHFLGDGYQILDWLRSSGQYNKPWAAGVHEVQWSLYVAVKDLSAQSALLAAQLYSYLSGIVFVVGAAWLVGRLFDHIRDRLIMLLGLCTGGQMLLYFGYVENYPLFVTAVALFCLTGLGVVRGQIRRLWLLIPLAAVVSLHIFCVAVIPAAVYLLVRDTALGKRMAGLSLAVRWGLALFGLAIAIAAFFYAYAQSYFFRFTVVPFVDGPLVAEGYTMFSSAHLLDYVNLLWQHAPALLLFVAVLFLVPLRILLIRPDYRYLVLLLVPSLIMVFIFQPGLGMPRDWDLFGFLAIPILLMGFYAIIDNQEKLSGYVSVSILAVALGFMLLVPRVVTQMIPDKGVEVFDRMAALDPIRNHSGRFIQLDYFERRGDTASFRRVTELCEVKYPQERWYEEGRILMEQGQTQAAAERLRDAVNFDPTYGHAWNGLGLYYYRQGRYDSALICWRIAAAVTPFYADRLRHLGMGYEAVGDSARAESCWLKAVELDSSDIASYMSLVKLYREQGRDEEYDAWLSRLAERPDVPLPVLVEYADHLAYAGDLRQAAEEFRRALERGLDTAFVRQRQDHYPGLEVIE